MLVLGIGSVTSAYIAAYYSEETFYAMPCSGLSYKLLQWCETSSESSSGSSDTSSGALSSAVAAMRDSNALFEAVVKLIE